MITSSQNTSNNVSGRLLAPNKQTWQQVLFFTFSAFCISQAMQISEGFNPNALLGVTFAFIWCAIGIIQPHISWSPHGLRKGAYAILCATVFAQLFQPLLSDHGLSSKVFKTNDAFHAICIGFVIITIACIVWSWNNPRWRILRYIGFPAILLAHFYLGVKSIHQNPGFIIDVLLIQHESVKALLSGVNPYSITFFDMHGGKSPYYGEGLVVNGRLMFGYVYPPLSLLMGVPGFLIGGDVRYSNLVSITLTGAFLGYARFNQIGFLAAILFLFTPSVYYILVRCWTDAFVCLFLAATLFCACRFPRSTPIAFGLMLAVKQHLFLCAPLAVLLTRAPRAIWRTRPFFVVVALIILVISLPLILWNVKDFIYSGVILNFRQPFRTDSLNYAALWALSFGTQPSSLVGFILLIPTYILLLRKSNNTPSGFASAFALLYLVFFLFGRQAFINYYYTIFASLCGAIATLDSFEIDGDLNKNVN